MAPKTCVLPVCPSPGEIQLPAYWVCWPGFSTDAELRQGWAYRRLLVESDCWEQKQSGPVGKPAQVCVAKLVSVVEPAARAIGGVLSKMHWGLVTTLLPQLQAQTSRSDSCFYL